MTYEITKSGIKYEWSFKKLFKLFPIKGVHCQKDIKDSKAELRKDFEVDFIQVEWITKEQNDQLKLWMHPIAAENNKLNVELNEVVYG